MCVILNFFKMCLFGLESFSLSFVCLFLKKEKIKKKKKLLKQSFFSEINAKKNGQTCFSRKVQRRSHLFIRWKSIWYWRKKDGLVGATSPLVTLVSTEVHIFNCEHWLVNVDRRNYIYIYGLLVSLCSHHFWSQNWILGCFQEKIFP